MTGGELAGQTGIEAGFAALVAQIAGTGPAEARAVTAPSTGTVKASSASAPDRVACGRGALGTAGKPGGKGARQSDSDTAPTTPDQAAVAAGPALPGPLPPPTPTTPTTPQAAVQTTETGLKSGGDAVTEAAGVKGAAPAPRLHEAASDSAQAPDPAPGHVGTPSAHPKAAGGDGAEPPITRSEPAPIVGAGTGPAPASGPTAAGTARAGAALAAELRPAPAADAALARAAQVAQAVAGLSSAAGIHRVTVQLSPEELGRLQISVVRAAGGDAVVNVVAERPETLALLQDDSGQLNAALDKAGLEAAGRSVHFHLAPAPQTVAAADTAGNLGQDRSSGTSNPWMGSQGSGPSLGSGGGGGFLPGQSGGQTPQGRGAPEDGAFANTVEATRSFMTLAAPSGVMDITA